MRARLHVRGDRVGFFREGTHDLCDAAATGQLTAASRGRGGGMRRAPLRAGAFRCRPSSSRRTSPPISASRTSLPSAANNIDRGAAGRGAEGGGLTGVTGLDANGVVRTAGVPVVSDPLSVLTMGAAASGALAAARRIVLPGQPLSAAGARRRSDRCRPRRRGGAGPVRRGGTVFRGARRPWPSRHHRGGRRPDERPRSASQRDAVRRGAARSRRERGAVSEAPRRAAWRRSSSTRREPASHAMR